MARKVKPQAPKPVLEPEDQLIEPTEAEKAELEAQAAPEPSNGDNEEKYEFFGNFTLARRSTRKPGPIAHIKREQILKFLDSVKGQDSYKTTSYPVDMYVSPITTWLKYLGLVKKIPGGGFYTVPNETEVRKAWNEAVESTKI